MLSCFPHKSHLVIDHTFFAISTCIIKEKLLEQEIRLGDPPKRSHTYEYGEKHFVCISSGVCLEFDQRWDAEMTLRSLRKCGLISA